MEQNPSLIWPLPDDITLEVLLRLPAKSVGRFRCVSKRFLSLTTHPQFIKIHPSISPISVTGFYFGTFKYKPELFSLNPSSSFPSSDDPSLSFLDYKGFPADIVDSCNGLILCRFERQETRLLSVCNPSTREHDVFPFPVSNGQSRFFLAFDPHTPPPLFKVFYITAYSNRYAVHSFSSETRSWKLVDGDFHVNFHNFEYLRSVFWKGTLCWVVGDRILCLDAETEKFSHLPLPLWTVRKCIRESEGRLHCISNDSFNNNSHLDIFEMESKSSGWSLLHHVNLDAIVDVYPEARKKKFLLMKVLLFIRGGGMDEVGDRLLLSVPTKIVVYHLKDKSFSSICSDLPHYSSRYTASLDMYSTYGVYAHANTLFSLNARTPHEDWVCWKSKHDKLLVSLMVEQSLNGQKYRLGFTTVAWHDMMEKFNIATKMNYGVHHLKNRFESYKREYRILKKILSRAGFCWNPEQQMVSASDDDWRGYLEHNERWAHSVYKKKKVPFRDLEIICSSSSSAGYQEVAFSKITDTERGERNFDNKEKQKSTDALITSAYVLQHTKHTLPSKRKR